MPPFSQQTSIMTIEGLGKKFQEARRARNLTLDEAARMTKIRPARLAEIEADDFSQFPSLAYAKGFLLIYGKFLDIDVTPYLEAFEDSEHVTVDGYSYLQENLPPKAVSRPVVRPSGGGRISPMPLIFGILVLVIGFGVMKLILNLQRLAPRRAEPTAHKLHNCTISSDRRKTGKQCCVRSYDCATGFAHADGCANGDSGCSGFRAHTHRAAGGPTSRTCTPSGSRKSACRGEFVSGGIGRTEPCRYSVT